MEQYLEAADKALERRHRQRPAAAAGQEALSLKDERASRSTSESVYRYRTTTRRRCFSSSAWNTVTLWQFYPPDRGHYRFRISASRRSERRQAGHLPRDGRHDADGDEEPPRRLLRRPGRQADRGRVRRALGGRGTTFASRPVRPGRTPQTVEKIGADKYNGPGLAVQWVEIEGPLHDTWPPASHRRIFGDLEQSRARSTNNSKRVEVVSKNPMADAERILARLRPPRLPAGGDRRRTSSRSSACVKAKLAAKQSFEQAMRVGLKAVLVSPHFLFLREKPGKLDDFALASAALVLPVELDARRGAARPSPSRGSCASRTCSARQVERMLKDPKAAAFTENFVGQWLGLREIDATDARSHALSRVRRHAQGGDGQGDGAVLRRSAEERPEPDELRRLRLHDAQRPAGEALRHPRRGRARSSAR